MRSMPSTVRATAVASMSSVTSSTWSSPESRYEVATARGGVPMRRVSTRA
jgi:hypothetical protein